MGNTRSSELVRIDWLAKEPPAPHIDAYMMYLANRGYATNTFSSYITSIAHFAQWLHGRRLHLGGASTSPWSLNFLTIIFLDAAALAQFNVIDAI